MEHTIDFDTWISEYIPVDVKYVAVFDNVTGAVKSVGPSHAFENIDNKFEIDSELAESILSGKINISHCVIDVSNFTLEIKDDFDSFNRLYKIKSKKFNEYNFSDVYLTHTAEKKELKIELAKELGGTRYSSRITVNNKITWDKSKKLKFLITAENNPNVIYDIIEITIEDLIDNIFTYQLNDSSFSVFTYPVFKIYSIEYL